MFDERTGRADIVLATANARYGHTSLALRYLLANMGVLSTQALILEFTLEERAEEVAEKILARFPQVVLLSVYIWNVVRLTEVAAIIRRVAPDVKIVLGGPEVSFETEAQAIVHLADHVITGEGEISLPRLVFDILARQDGMPKVVTGETARLEDLVLPYHLYSDEDIAHRVIYVEASRGCPFECEFCLSSLDTKVRRFPQEKLVEALDDLWRRGAKRFKFLDRALHLAVWPALLDFFADKRDPALFLHFELVPDRLPTWAVAKLSAFSEGQVQLEAGLQTLNDEVASRIGRQQHTEKALENLAALRRETGVYLHADLVVGLPGESLTSFAEGFDRLMGLGLQEIQVGILKRLRGAPISRHDGEWAMVYSDHPPYEILCHRLIDFAVMQRIKRFAKYFDLICNRGRFLAFEPLIWEGGSAFERLFALSDWLYEKSGRTHAIELGRLAEWLFEYVTTALLVDPRRAADCLQADFKCLGRRGLPNPIAAFATPGASRAERREVAPLPPRQKRHL